VKSTVFICLAAAFAGSIQAQSPAQSGKAGVINFQMAIVSTKDGQKAANDLDAKFAPKRKELEQRQNELNGLQDQLAKGQNTLSESAKADLYKNIEAKKKVLQRDFEDTKEEWEQEQQKMIQQIAQKMSAVIERYAKDHTYAMVMDVSNPQSPFLYASPTIDITKDIIELYDQNASAMTNPAPAKPATPGTAAPKSAAPATKPPATKPPGSN
jgi:outer membrane protein